MQLYSEIVNLIREQNHDFLNHVQVVMGNLQLNKKDRALTYLREVTSGMHEMGLINKLSNPYLAIRLLLMMQKSKTLDVNFNIEFNAKGECSSCYKQESIDLLINICEIALNNVSKNNEESCLKLSYNENNEYSYWNFSLPLDANYDEICSSVRKCTESYGGKLGEVSVERFSEGMEIIFAISKE